MSEKTKVVAVSGASGMIGGALCQHLSERGWKVAPMVRSEGREGIFWSAQEGRIDKEALSKVDAVVHLAGENLTEKRWTEEQKRRILESRVQGTNLIAGAMAEMEEGPKVLVSASAVGYYGARGDEVLDEESDPGTGFLAEVCRKWEEAAEPAREAGIRVVHPRIGIVLSRQGGALGKMMLPFKLGIGGKLGSGDQYFSWVTLQDTVRAIRFLLEHEEMEGPVNLSAPEPVTNQEFTKALGKALGRPTVLPVPGFALKTLMGKELAEEALLEGQRVRPARLLEAGFEFRAPTVAEGLEQELNR